MGKKISRVLPTERDYPVRPYALINHTHEFYANTVADLTARDAIEGDRRYEGVIYYVESDQITYQLRGGSENTDWVVMVSALGATSHLDLTNIGTNTHDQIDTHIADADLHFTQASISIEESQISDLKSYALASHDHDTAYLGITATATAANALSTTGASVNVSGAAPPVVGQILTATSATAATWQNATAAGIGDIVQTGTPVNTYVGYFTADKNLSGDAGFTWITASARLNVIGASPVIRLQDDDNVAATMVAALEFYDSAALAGQLFFTSGAVTLQNLGGDIVFDTNGTATVSVTGDGDLNIGGYITDFAGTPTDGQLLVWVTANSRAEFATAPTGIVPDGTPVDNQVVVFTSATNADGSTLFTWDGSILTVDAFVLNNSNDVFTIGDGVETVPGIEINGSATASPFINLQQSAVTQSIFRYNNTLSRTELSSLDDEIALRPGNVDTLILTQATATFSSAVLANNRVQIEGTAPKINMIEDDVALDQKTWRFWAENEGFNARIWDDAIANYYTWLQVERSGTGAGVQVDTIDFTAATDITLNSAVNVTGAFTSLGIDDNATAEMLQLADGILQLSASGTDFAILMKGNTDKLQISGGASAATGAAIQLRGSTDVNASDFEIWADGNVWMHWDESVGDLELLTGIGAKTSALTIDASQNATFAGDVTVEGTGIFGENATPSAVLQANDNGTTKAALLASVQDNEGTWAYSAINENYTTNVGQGLRMFVSNAGEGRIYAPDDGVTPGLFSIFTDGAKALQVGTDKVLTVKGQRVDIGVNAGGDAKVNFFDDTNTAWRSIFWDDSESAFMYEDSAGAFNQIGSGSGGGGPDMLLGGM